jgi:GNAT superfamily N-acetyltransferase
MSTDKFDLQKLTVKSLNKEMDLSCFDCSQDDDLDLNGFIHNEALQYQQDGMGTTYTFHYQNDFVGYVTVAMHAIEVKETRLHIVTNQKHYPALLLGRLGVHNNYRNRGVGHSMCLWTIGYAKKLSKEVGCRFVVLLTTPSKVEFYRKCGFEVCPKYERKQKVLMYFQIS